MARRAPDAMLRSYSARRGAMMRFAATIAVIASLTCTAQAHGPNDPPHQTFALGHLKLESGDTIKDFSISSVTHGTLRINKTNAIIMVTAIVSDPHRIDYLVRPRRAVDPAKDHIITTD